MKKLLFIEVSGDYKMMMPHSVMPPLWALVLATYLKERISNLDIKIIDGKHLSVATLKREITNQKPDWVGFSPKIHNYLNVLKLCRFSKKIGAKTILGGIQATNLRKEILQNRGKYSKDFCVDVVIQGDGEKALYEYISGKPLSKINNLVFIDKKREIKENPQDYLDLDSLPIPDRDLVNIQRDYFKKGQPKVLDIYSQKGCRWRVAARGGCIFCLLRDSVLRLRNPEKIWQEIEYLVRKYNTEIIWDGADNFLNNREWLENLYQKRPRFLKLPKLVIYARPDDITEEVAKILKELNVHRVQLGLESASSRMLAKLRKGTAAERNKKGLEILHKYGVKTYHFFLVGAPDETMETALQTLKFAKKLAKSKMVLGTQIVKLRPYPGSLAWEMLLEKTGDKYKGKDNPDTKQVMEDWINNFCKVSLDDLKKFSKLIPPSFLKKVAPGD